MTMKELNQKTLNKIAHRSTTSEAVFSLLALRERSRGETDLRRLRNELVEEGFRVVPDEFLDTFRDLASVGVGELIEAKSGVPARFKWHFSLKDISRKALESQTKTIPAPKLLKSVKPEIRSITAYLDMDRFLRVELPVDLSAEEVAFIKEIIDKQLESAVR